MGSRSGESRNSKQYYKDILQASACIVGFYTRPLPVDAWALRADGRSVMSADDQELRALAFLALRIRRATNGAGPWDEDGLMTNLRKIQNRNLHMLVEHTIRHAADPAAKTPGVLAGSFTPPAPKAESRTWKPPKKSEECTRHPGQWPTACGPCATENTPAYYDPDPTEETTVTTGAEAARAALQAATTK